MDDYCNLKKVILNRQTIDCIDSNIERECFLIASDLSQDGCLCPLTYASIPSLTLVVGLENGKLKLQFTDVSDLTHSFILSLSPYIRLIREYKDICSVYKHAILNDTITSIETIDMARRGLHNQAADLIKDRLSDKIRGNHDAFRHLFSLITAIVNVK